MKKIVVLFVMTMSSFAAFSQTGFGLNGGILFSTINDGADTTREKLYGSPKLKTGFKAGFFLEIPISSTLYLNPELNYVNKGYKYEKSSGTGSTMLVRKIKETTHYAELPVNLKYKPNGSSGGLVLGAGPVLGYGLSGKRDRTTVGAVTQPSDQDVKFDGEKNANTATEVHLKALEIGANIFVGYELTNGLMLNLQARPNFNNLEPTDISRKYRNSYYGLNISARL